MPKKDVEGLPFDVTVAPLVENVIAEARILAGAECIYIANKQLRAARVPQRGDKDAQGVFVMIKPAIGGATIIRPTIPKDDPKRRDLEPGNISDVISTMKTWHRAVQPLRKYADPEETKNPLEVSGGKFEGNKSKF